MRRVRVPSLPCVSLDSATDHRLRHVLRLRPGTLLTAFDGSGCSQLVRLTTAGLEPLGAIESAPPRPRVELILAVLKHSAMDRAVRMATEVGVHSIQPVFTERTIAKGDRTERWQRIVTSAAIQCARDQEPRVHRVCSLLEAVESCSIPVFFGQPGHPGPSRTETAALVVGPAGGLSTTEQDLLLQAGASPMGMGPYVLRAETAAAVGVSLLVQSTPSSI